MTPPSEKPTGNPEVTIGGYRVWHQGIQKRIGGARVGEDGGYVLAEIAVTHAYECRAWRAGRRHGPCTCGGQAAWQAFAKRQGDADPFAAIRVEEGGQ